MTDPAPATERPARPWWQTFLLGGVPGLLWFLIRGGAEVVPPGSFNWLLSGDPSVHLTGWLQFRLSPWQWPLGTIPGFLYPMGASVATTDSMPWLAVLGKLLSPVLPQDFQYFGLYLLASFVLQGAMGARLTSLVTDRRALQALGGAAFAVSPILFDRLGHTTLTAHWVVLLALDANLRPLRDRRQALRTMAVLGGLVLFLAGIHPYLTCMVLPFVWTFLWTCARSGLVRAWWCAAAGAASLAAAAGLFLLFGYIGGPESAATNGFGVFSADALTLINPTGRSRFFPSFPVNGGQDFEGFGYLGPGVIALGLAVAGATVARRRLPEGWKRAIPVSLVALGWFVYALSQKVTAAGHVLLDLEALYAPLAEVTGALRSSGRFVWPLHYALTAAAVLGWIRWQRARPAVAVAGLAAVVAFQVADLWTPTTVAERTARAPIRTMPSDLGAWSRYQGYRHLALVPPRVGLGESERDKWLREVFGYVAYHLGTTYNSGYTARLRWRLVVQAYVQMEQEIRAGVLRPDTVYVFEPRRQPLPTWRCDELSSVQVCVAAPGPPPN